MRGRTGVSADELGEWVTPRQAADALNKSDQAVLAWIRTGELAAEDIEREGRFYRVRWKAVEQLARTKPGPRGSRRPTPRSSAANDSVGDADGLRAVIKDLEHTLAERTEECERLRAENHTLRETAADLNRALARWAGPKDR